MKPSGKDSASQVRWSPGEGIGPGRPELLREVNARRVLRLLRLHGPCSRADLVRSSGLSAPTISSGIDYLQKKGLVEPLGPGPSSGGRPPSLLRFNSKLGYVVGADIGTSVVRVALADLNGAIVEEWVGPTKSHSTPERVARLIRVGIEKLQQNQKVSSKKLLGLVAGVPGITDARAGIVLSAPMLPAGWQAVPLREILEAKTGIPTVVENDVNLAALGESWQGTARGVKDFVFLTIGSGVGAGIFVNGRLYHGSEWAAGEIGYLYVPGTEETPLAIRRPGSLESIIGANAIKQSWEKLCNASRRIDHPQNRNISVDEILDLAEKGENHAEEILQRTARILADAITNVCVILNSSLVVLGGRVGSHPALFKATARILERNEFCRPRLALSDLGREAPLFGAIWLVLKSVEGRILPPPSNTSRPVTTDDGSGVFQSFLALS
jgi:glucokinase